MNRQSGQNTPQKDTFMAHESYHENGTSKFCHFVEAPCYKVPEQFYDGESSYPFSKPSLIIFKY